MLPAQIAAYLAAGGKSRALLLYFKTPQPNRFWTGPGPLSTDPLDGLDPAATYQGAGVLKTWPSLRQLTGGVAERVDFGFHHDTPGIDDLMSDPSDAAVHVGFVCFGADWQITGPAAWLWHGRVDQAGEALNGLEKTLTLSCISGAALRAQASERYWSNLGHQARHAGDLFFSEIQGLTVNTTRKW